MSNPGSPALSEALEATTLNVEVEDPKLYHDNCVDVIANKVADGSVDLVLNDPPRSWLGLSTCSQFFSDTLYDWRPYGMSQVL
jgi:predicted methyltransferase